MACSTQDYEIGGIQVHVSDPETEICLEAEIALDIVFVVQYHSPDTTPDTTSSSPIGTAAQQRGWLRDTKRYLHSPLFRRDLREGLLYKADRAAEELAHLDSSRFDDVAWRVKGKGGLVHTSDRAVRVQLVVSGTPREGDRIRMCEISAFIAAGIAWNDRASSIPSTRFGTLEYLPDTVSADLRVDRVVLSLTKEGPGLPGKGPRVGPTACRPSKLKKYTTRPGPPYPAQHCCGLARRGNDGRPYLSRPDRRDVCRWTPTAPPM